MKGISSKIVQYDGDQLDKIKTKQRLREEEEK